MICIHGVKKGPIRAPDTGTSIVPSYTHREDIDLITRAWSELKSLVKEGLVRHLGVSDFPLAALRFLDEWESRDDQQGLRPDICQVEHHPYYRDEELMEYCQSRSGATGPIQVVAHTPLGRPGK